MTSICGIVRRDGRPVPEAQLRALCEAMRGWGPDGFGTWIGGHVALAQGRGAISTPERCEETLPRRDELSGIAITAAGRLDNREELLATLGLRPKHGGVVPDGDILAAGYARWGDRAPPRMLGDWALAAWHERERRLFLARDHFGLTAIYYVTTDEGLVFSSSCHALVSLGYVLPQIDELYLARVLTSWQVRDAHATIHPSLRRLPPAHALTLSDGQPAVRRYWDMGEVSQFRLRRRADYVDAFRELFDASVEARLRSRGPVGLMLSGGLDSGSVTATAAHVAGPSTPAMIAFTSVPAHDPAPYVGSSFGDELPLAALTASVAGVELVQIVGTSLSPIGAIRRSLEIHGEPMHAAGNQFWLLELFEVARQRGCSTMLIGQFGNAGVSWTGWPTMSSVRHRPRLGAVARLFKAQVRPYVPVAVRRSLRARAAAGQLTESAIDPGFAARIGLNAHELAGYLTPATPLEQRLIVLQQGLTPAGATLKRVATAHGLDIRDPTADVRLLEFVLGVPDHIFTGSPHGIDRWLIREAMVDRLPADVRLNRRRGRQAGDLVPRLRATASEVDAALEEIDGSLASCYLDIGKMRGSWRLIQRLDTAEAHSLAVTTLTRGLMAGLFLANLNRSGPLSDPWSG